MPILILASNNISLLRTKNWENHAKFTSRESMSHRSSWFTLIKDFFTFFSQYFYFYSISSFRIATTFDFINYLWLWYFPVYGSSSRQPALSYFLSKSSLLSRLSGFHSILRNYEIFNWLGQCMTVTRQK